jgi:hypothetical protein
MVETFFPIFDYHGFLAFRNPVWTEVMWILRLTWPWWL